MKHTFFLTILLAAFLITSSGYSQVVNEKTKKRISIGVGLSTDIMMKMPSGIKARVINQGVNVYGTYNIPFGKSNFSFALGVGLSSHNIYGNFIVNSTPDSTWLKKSRIPSVIKEAKSTLFMLKYLSNSVSKASQK